MGFNFSEEEITNMYGMYQNVLETIQEETKKVVEDITLKAREVTYKVIIDMSVEAVEYYNEELKNSELRALAEWQDSELSFTKFMERMSAGENAKDRSRTLESSIEDEIHSWKTLDTSQLTSIVDTNAKCKLEDFEDIKEIINRFTSELESEKGRYASILSNKKEENTIYVSIEPVILQSIEIVIEGFKSGINESFAELAQEFDKKDKEAQALGADTVNSVKTKSKKYIDDEMASLKSKVKLIF